MTEKVQVTCLGVEESKFLTLDDLFRRKVGDRYETDEEFWNRITNIVVNPAKMAIEAAIDAQELTEVLADEKAPTSWVCATAKAVKVEHIKTEVF